MNILDAAYNLVARYPGGAGSLAPRMGKGVSTLSHECTASGTAKLGLLDAVKMTDFANDDAILMAWALHRNRMLVPLPVNPSGHEGCMAKLADAAKEFGDFITEVSGDLADGKITDNELARIDKESGELIAALYELRKDLAAKNAELHAVAPKVDY